MNSLTAANTLYSIFDFLSRDNIILKCKILKNLENSFEKAYNYSLNMSYRLT